MSAGGSAGIPPKNFGVPPASASIGFPAETITLPCGLSISFPAFNFGFSFPGFGFLLPGLFAAFNLSCDLSKPINISAGMSGPAAQYGGARPYTAPADPDLNDDTP